MSEEYSEGYEAGLNRGNEDAGKIIDVLQAENARLREQAEALEAAHQRVRSIILSVENRCMAADGPVSRTLEEMTEDELRAIWQASDAALCAYQEATP